MEFIIQCSLLWIKRSPLSFLEAWFSQKQAHLAVFWSVRSQTIIRVPNAFIGIAVIVTTAATFNVLSISTPLYPQLNALEDGVPTDKHYIGDLTESKDDRVPNNLVPPRGCPVESRMIFRKEEGKRATVECKEISAFVTFLPKPTKRTIYVQWQDIC